MKGELILVDNIDLYDEEFEMFASTHDFALTIYVDDKKTLDKQLKNRREFDKCMKFQKEFIDKNKKIDRELEKQIQYLEQNFDNMIDSVEYVKLLFDYHDIKEFIKKNPMLLSKKIVIGETLKIVDYDKLLELINKYEDIVDRVYVQLMGNQNYISLFDCYKTMSTIKKQADNIKKLNLSPMETIMYLYDQVRNRVYKFENEDETSFKSRDLSEVIFGDKIVCAGYANIFYTFLHYLGIKNEVVHLRDRNDSENENGHVRNVVYIVDPKYDIDGVYYFDATWDSKIKEDDNSYLYKYNYFAKTREFMDNDKNFDFEDICFPRYSTNMYNKIKDIIEKDDFYELLSYIKSINYMSSMVNEGMLIDLLKIIPMDPFHGKFDIKSFLIKFKKICNKFDKQLSAEVMIKLLNNVRKIEYYQNPEWYPYSVEDIYKTFIKSKWEFSDKHLDSKMLLLKSIFGNKVLDKIGTMDNFRNYGLESKLFESVEQVRLAKALQKVLIKKANTSNIED